MEKKRMDIKKILILLIFAIAIAGIIAPASAAVDSADNNKVYSVESKEKSAANKITWNANGGTIGSKKTITTNVKKGSKIGKLPTTPKRSGHTFNSWYTKKTGGNKITANTKPTKAVTYYAQWKVTPKKEDKSKFVGKWIYENILRDGKWISTKSMGVHGEATLRANGSYYFLGSGTAKVEGRGSYSMKNQKIIIASEYRMMTNNIWSSWEKHQNAEAFITKINGKEYLQFGNIRYVRA